MSMRLIPVTLLFFIVSCTASVSNRYDVSDFGAVKDGTTLDTDAIQQAIDKAAAKGGGTVYFSPGTYLTGTIQLKSNVSLQFESGAKLLGSENLTDYTGEKKSLIVGEDLQNIKISGKGIIDGNGETFWDDDFKALPRPEPWILLKNCTNLSISEVKFMNSPSHTIRLESSQDVVFDDISIVNDFRGPNTDGIDIVDSQNIHVSNSYISTGDDAICLKTRQQAVENVIVTNCMLESDDAAIKFGTGSRVATRFCVFSDITIRKTRYGIAMFMLDGGIYEHNQFSNITIETDSRHKHEYPIYIDIDKRTDERSYGQVFNNSFNDIKIVSDGKVLISGHPESYIESLDLNNLSFHLKEDQDFSNAKKPRGNKKYPKLGTSDDLSRENGVFVLGYTNRAVLNDLTVTKDTELVTQRRAIIPIEVKELDNTDFRNLLDQ
ncbi:MAG: glycosyl hydrolase family 28 protein [Bacteroidota bacterium]